MAGVERVFDLPMRADGLTKPLCGHGSRGNLKPPAGFCARFGFNLAFDRRDSGEFSREKRRPPSSQSTAALTKQRRSSIRPRPLSTLV
jgi:hypothetical protein